MEDIVKLVYSGGANNKNPDESLGGGVSVFEINTLPMNCMNNLFRDASPEEAAAGLTSYRCFYVINKRQDASLKNVKVMLQIEEECGEITFGAKQKNDEQILTFVGHPILGGFVILKTEFGTPFTCEMTFDMSDEPDWSSFRSVLENTLQNTQEFSSQVTVSTLDIYPDPPGGAQYKVTFGGDLKNKRMKLIQLIQNSMTNQSGPEYRCAKPGAGYNGNGNTTLKVTRDIDAGSVAPEGYLHYFNPYTGLFVRAKYTAISGPDFTLEVPLVLDNNGSSGVLNTNDEVWVELPDIQFVSLGIKKKTEGSPVGQLAQMIPREDDVPTDWEEAEQELEVGVVRPNEGFFVWMKRKITSTEGCTGRFSIVLSADLVDWPYTP